jgi:hypothetical protein
VNAKADSNSTGDPLPRRRAAPLSRYASYAIHRSTWKRNSPKFAVANDSSTQRQPLQESPCCTPAGSERGD